VNVGTRFLCLLGSVFLATAALAQPPPFISTPHLADYDAELRRPDGRVDTDAMLQRLKELHVTTYYWLVWHKATDWDDLKLFLPKAAQAHLDVWVYLVPPTEGPPHAEPASEPFKLDYPRWAAEIARLSLQFPNLTGWVIDDFYANHDLFTPEYTRQMRAKAKAVNPRVAFLPLMYFPEITAQFASDYREAIDGVVVAYPQDRDEIQEARAVLDGEAAAKPGRLSCPWHTPTHAEDYVSASTWGKVVSPDRAHLEFQESDDFTGPTAGYHFKQLLINGAVVWEQDVAGGQRGWQDIKLDVSPQVRGKKNVTLTFRLFDKQGVSNFGVRWRLKNLRADGLKLAAGLDKPERWAVDLQGPFEAGFGAAMKKSERRIHIPFILMTAASADEFKLRHGEPASPERIAEWLRLSLRACKDGQCDGVVTYCLDKQPGSPVFPLMQQAFGEFRARK
jgi:hypothetical protein